MRSLRSGYGFAVAALALSSLSVALSPPADATCSIGINGQWVCEDQPTPVFGPQSDPNDCKPGALNSVTHSCPPCADLRGQPYGTPQPVLPCDHSQ